MIDNIRYNMHLLKKRKKSKHPTIDKSHWLAGWTQQRGQRSVKTRGLLSAKPF